MRPKTNRQQTKGRQEATKPLSLIQRRGLPAKENRQGPAVNLRQNAYDVYIGPPRPWGNPFRISPHGSRTNVIAEYSKWLLHQAKETKITVHHPAELHGVRNGCFCNPQPCHGDIL